MAKTFKEAVQKNRQASEDLDAALRDCLRALQERPDVVVEGRFKVFSGGRRAKLAQ